MKNHSSWTSWSFCLFHWTRGFFRHPSTIFSGLTPPMATTAVVELSFLRELDCRMECELWQRNYHLFQTYDIRKMINMACIYIHKNIICKSYILCIYIYIILLYINTILWYSECIIISCIHLKPPDIWKSLLAKNMALASYSKGPLGNLPRLGFLVMGI